MAMMEFFTTLSGGVRGPAMPLSPGTGLRQRWRRLRLGVAHGIFSSAAGPSSATTAHADERSWR